jgi:hypothetical protein
MARVRGRAGNGLGYYHMPLRAQANDTVYLLNRAVKQINPAPIHRPLAQYWRRLTSQIPYTNRSRLTSQIHYTNRSRLTSQIPYTNRIRLTSQIPYTNRIRLTSQIPYTNRRRRRRKPPSGSSTSTNNLSISLSLTPIADHRPSS